MAFETSCTAETAPATTTDQNNPTLSELPTRIRDIAALRGLGYSFREIAAPLNITPQAVSLMLSRHRRCLKSLRQSIELCHLSARAVNALGRLGINSREEARRRDVVQLLRHQRNCGIKTLDEISRWMNDGQSPN